MASPSEIAQGNCGSGALETTKAIVANSFPSSELYATMICGITATHIVGELNNIKQKVVYQLEMEPNILQEEDKKSDFTILKILNERTYVTIEVKLDVPDKVTAGTKNDLAQLFLEAIYCCKKESIDKLLAILTNGFVWHCFALDASHFPVSIDKYFKMTIDVNDSPAPVCNAVTNYILTNCFQQDQ